LPYLPALPIRDASAWTSLPVLSALSERFDKSLPEYQAREEFIMAHVDARTLELAIQAVREAVLRLERTLPVTALDAREALRYDEAADVLEAAYHRELSLQHAGRHLGDGAPELAEGPWLATACRIRARNA
jgi:hypothetical protein